VAQPIFLSKLAHNFYRGKSIPQIWTTCVFYKKKLPKEKKTPNGRKFAQSGHPE
jgi:hypothetical protein